MSLIRSLVLCLIVLYPFFLSGQPYRLVKHINSVGGVSKETKVFDVCKQVNGDFALVGHRRRASNDLDSYLTIMPRDPNRAARSIPLIASEGDLDDGLHAIGTGIGGLLWAGGYMTKPGEGLMPRLLRIDYHGEVIEVAGFSSYIGFRIEELVVLADGSLFLYLFNPTARTPEQKHDFLHFRDGTFRQVPALDDLRSELYNVVTVQLLPNRSGVAIVANGLEKKRGMEGVVTVTTLDNNLQMLNAIHTDRKYFFFAKGAHMQSNGDLLLAGYHYPDNAYSDVWTARLSYQSSKIEQLADGVDKGDDQGNAIIPTPSNYFFVPQQYIKGFSGGQNPDHLLLLTATETRPTELEGDLPFGSQIMDMRLINTGQGDILMIGNEDTGAAGIQPCIALYAPMNQEITIRGQEVVECSPPTLTFGNGDDQIAPGEHPQLEFEVINRGKVPIWNASVQVDGHLVTGVRATYPVIDVPEIPSNFPIRIEVPISIEDYVSSGTSTFQLTLMQRQTPLCTVSKVVRTGTNQQGQTIMNFDISRSPDVEQKEGKLYTPHRQITIPVQMFSNQPIEHEHLRIIRKGVVNQGSKDLGPLENTGPVEGAKVGKRFTYTANLDEGENVITFILELPGEAPLTKILTIECLAQESKERNLHVLAIAPDYRHFTDRGYKKLRFNDDDVKGFTALMQQQQQLGMYKRVFIDTFLSVERTERLAIEKAFSDLDKRTRTPSLDNYIAKDDVVIIFFSGHADVIRGKFYLIPSLFDKNNKQFTSVNYKALIDEYVVDIGRKTLIFMDACRSGDSASKGNGVDEALSRELERLHAAVPGVAAFQSCGEGENSYETGGAIENGFFTEALLEALSGKQIPHLSEESTYSADANKDGFLSLKELFDYTGDRVPVLIRDQQFNYQQNPTLSDADTDQPLDLSLNYFRLPSTSQ